MKIEMYKCDRCGALIGDDRHRLVAPDGTEKDLCQACVNQIFRKEEKAEIPEVKVVPLAETPEAGPILGLLANPKEKAKKGDKKIDRGKIKALKKAGWKAWEIASECKCSEATVYNVLKEAEDETEL